MSDKSKFKIEGFHILICIRIQIAEENIKYVLLKGKSSREPEETFITFFLIEQIIIILVLYSILEVKSILPISRVNFGA